MFSILFSTLREKNPLKLGISDALGMSEQLSAQKSQPQKKIF